jgi:hypothetical protein
MKSLSMPDHLDSFAQDVAEMEQRLLKNHHASKQNEETHTLTSCYLKSPVKNEEEGDFFMQGIDIDDDDDDDADSDSDGTAGGLDQPANTQQPGGGYLPSFDYGAFSTDSSSIVNHSILSKSNNSLLRSSERILNVETVNEEKDDDDGYENQDMELEKQQKQRQQNAQAAIAELADLFTFPRQLHDDNDGSINRTQQQKIHPREVSPTGVACDLASSPSTSSLKEPHKNRRSIFNQLVEKYAWRPPPPEPEEEEYFTRLSQDARAQSLPACQGNLPRKGSLKRISSLCSNVNSESSSSLKRNVSFSSLEVREYNIALSDHPSCSYGPPIQLGWDYRQKKAVQVEEYEETRSQQPRRGRHELVLSYNVRRHLLLKRAGYSNEDLEEAMSEVDRVKRERTVTQAFLPASQLDETMEHVLDQVTFIFGGGSRNQETDSTGELSIAS